MTTGCAATDRCGITAATSATVPAIADLGPVGLPHSQSRRPEDGVAEALRAASDGLILIVAEQCPFGRADFRGSSEDLAVHPDTASLDG